MSIFFKLRTLNIAPTWAVHGLFKIDQVVEQLSDSLPLGSPYDIAYLVFSSKVRNFLRKCL